MKKPFSGNGLLFNQYYSLEIVIYNVKLAVSIYIELWPPFPEGDTLFRIEPHPNSLVALKLHNQVKTSAKAPRCI